MNPSRISPARLAAFASAFAAIPEAAFAHIVEGVGDFYTGILHPVTTFEHILPMVALGLLAGQSRRASAVAVVIAFPVGLLLGATASLRWGVPGFAGWVNVGSMLFLGALVALGKGLAFIPALLCASLFGLTHGLANGAELTSGMEALRFFPGVALAGFLTTVYGIGLVRRLKPEWTRIGVRVAGSWIAAVGLMLISLGQ